MQKIKSQIPELQIITIKQKIIQLYAIFII